MALAGVVAAISDTIERLTGRSLPLSRSRLRALTETTHFSCGRLKATGFRHPQSIEAGLEEMVAWYREQKREPNRKSFLGVISRRWAKKVTDILPIA
jgi:hypothetical protein